MSTNVMSMCTTALRKLLAQTLIEVMPVLAETVILEMDSLARFTVLRPHNKLNVDFQDLNECFIGEYDCQRAASCIDNNGSYRCECIVGYNGNDVEIPDTDERLQPDVANCGFNAQCHNTKGSYECVCNLGYIGDGVTCEDDDECLLNEELELLCHVDAHCINTKGSYKCECKGYVCILILMYEDTRSGTKISMNVR
ncbi:unnamed protein product [Clavelina lepadiformis]|uniref:EGF-like domain-containing protein n=1 Tax=Clavelina lepadiformis TaxID=159417 RepID=A0ABP0EZP4_CLALP